MMLWWPKNREPGADIGDIGVFSDAGPRIVALV